MSEVVSFESWLLIPLIHFRASHVPNGEEKAVAEIHRSTSSPGETALFIDYDAQSDLISPPFRGVTHPFEGSDSSGFGAMAAPGR